jgi:folate-binding protein YgfZ
MPEGGKDYDFGDAYPHEADFDLFNGVSFTKGCFVGQEVVARMQNKTVVRKRVVKITGTGPLTSGADVNLGDIAIGRVGTVDGTHGLAMVRLDRVLDAQQKNQPLVSAGTTIEVDAEALTRYSASLAARPSATLPS